MKFSKIKFFFLRIALLQLCLSNYYFSTVAEEIETNSLGSAIGDFVAETGKNA